MRLVYFVYFILNANYSQVWSSIRCKRPNHNCLKLVFDALWCSLTYGTSLNDYFNFRFFQKDKKERKEYATTAYMYVFHKKLNKKGYKSKIDNKTQFRQHFKRFSGNSEIFSVRDPQKLIHWINKNNVKDLVIKDPLGTVGKSVMFLTYAKESQTFIYHEQSITIEKLFSKFSKNGYLYVEPRIKQHIAVQNLAPSALNTIRVITVLRKDGLVDIISAAFRISVNSETDNFSTGNLAAAVDINTGIVVSPGIKRLAACSDSYEYHPVTNQKILGFQVPHWDKVLNIINEAAKVIPQVRTVGWDVAILEDKPIIIEGNPSWNKGAPQIPLDKGIKPTLDRYLGENGL